MAKANDRPKPPECLKGGKPPCPLCPLVSRCAWGSDHVKIKDGGSVVAAIRYANMEVVK